MARRGTQVDESVDCRGIGVGAATERLLELAGAHYRAVNVGAGRFRFARSYRPAWAVFLGCALAPTIVGLLLLLIRTTETFDATIEEDHRRVRVRLSGRVLPQLLLAVREAMQRGPDPVAAPVPSGVVADHVATPSGPVAAVPVHAPPEVTPVPLPDAAPVPPPVLAPEPAPVAPVAPVVPVVPAASPAGGPTAPLTAPLGAPVPAARRTAFAPPAPLPSEGDGSTSLHPRLLPDLPTEDEAVDDRTTVVPRNGTPVPARQPVLCFDTGERHVLRSPLLVGRDPASTGGHAVVAVDDPDMSVSKTHLEVRPGPGGVVVSDRGSTNGTAVEDERGALTPVAAGAEVSVGVGATVRFGTRSFLVTEEQA